VKVIAFNGSAREDGNTSILIGYVLGELQKEGIETETFNLSGKKIHGCRACGKCFEVVDRRCAVKNDVLNECIEKMLEADGIILGSPTYFTDVSTEMKALIDRAGLVAKANGGMFRRKVGAAVIAVRRAGSLRHHETAGREHGLADKKARRLSFLKGGGGRSCPRRFRGDQDGTAGTPCGASSRHRRIPPAQARSPCRGSLCGCGPVHGEGQSR